MGEGTGMTSITFQRRRNLQPLPKLPSPVKRALAARVRSLGRHTNLPLANPPIAAAPLSLAPPPHPPPSCPAARRSPRRPQAQTRPSNVPRERLCPADRALAACTRSLGRHVNLPLANLPVAAAPLSPAPPPHPRPSRPAPRCSPRRPPARTRLMNAFARPIARS